MTDDTEWIKKNQYVRMQQFASSFKAALNIFFALFLKNPLTSFLFLSIFSHIYVKIIFK